MKDSDRYLKIVEWSEEDQCYVGTCPGLFYGGCHGDNETDVYKELCEIVEENIVLYKENGKSLPPATAGKEYSGKFLLRPGKELHKALAIRALQADESLNNFCLNSLKKVIFCSNRSKGLTDN
ncbi:MAG: toxin-antitoxin system HicB family antitoxin [Thermodesulfobacteriota bacterium]|nr:toxin-antitoxin system HicB family antitoxin [Thermodesulfobacteriota bacterium]